MKKSLFIALTMLSLIAAAAGPAHSGGKNPANLFPEKAADKSKALQPAGVSLIEPTFMAKIATDSITLKWAPVASVENYHLQVATDANFKWLVADQSLLKATSFELKGLEKAKQYYWRVAAQKPENDSTYTKGFFSASMFETR